LTSGPDLSHGGPITHSEPCGRAAVVFVSYSHKDEEWKDKLLPQLKHLGRLGILQVWDDRQIKAGVDWYARIREILRKTRCAICLISDNFLNSSFCMDEEIPYLLQQRYRGQLELFPVLLSDCVWEAHPWLKRWQIRPPDARSIETHFANNPKQVFADLAREAPRCPGIDGGKSGVDVGDIGDHLLGWDRSLVQLAPAVADRRIFRESAVDRAPFGRRVIGPPERGVAPREAVLENLGRGAFTHSGPSIQDRARVQCVGAPALRCP
jgi:TIR domain